MKEELLSLFIGAHMLKKTSGKSDVLLYGGNLKQLNLCFNETLAIQYNKIHKDIININTIELQLFGGAYTLAIPILDADEIDNIVSTDVVNEDYLAVLYKYLKSGIFSDQRYKIYSGLLNSFDIVVINDSYIGYVKKNIEEIKVINNDVDVVVGGVNFSVNVETDVSFNRYDNIMLLIKEVQSGYYDTRTHSMVETVQKKSVQQNYKIGEDITIELNAGDVISVSNIPTEYGAIKEDGDFFVVTPGGEKISTRVFNPVQIIKQEGDYTKLKLIGAYTHGLRKAMEFNPLTWQMRFLLNMNRLNYIAGCRRAGKTKLSAYLITRELWKIPQTLQQLQRPIKTLYIAPTDDKLEEVLDYIKTASSQVRALKIMRVLEGKKKRVILSDEKVSRVGKIYDDVGVCMLASAKGYEPGRGKASDFIIIDESGFIPEDVYLNILPIVENEKAKLYCISTIDWNTPRQWFYECLVEAENLGDPDTYAQRVTIDDIDDVLVDANSKRRMKSALMSNPQRYYAELYATFPNMDSVFSTEGFFIVPEYGREPDEVIIGYDPAKRADLGALIVGELYGDKLVLNKEIQLQGEYSTIQKERIIQLKTYYFNKGIKCNLIMDSTGAGDVVSEIMSGLVDFKVWYNGKIKRPAIDAWGCWTVSKTTLVTITQILLESGYIKANVSLEKLMYEIKNFKQYKTQSGNVQYEADVGHDDLVNAMMLVCFYFGFLSGKMYEVMGNINQDYVQAIGDTNGGLYKTTSYRSTGQAPVVKSRGYFGI